MGKERVELTENEKKVLEKYKLRTEDLANFMSMSYYSFLNSSAKDRFKKAIAQTILFTEGEIIKKL